MLIWVSLATGWGQVASVRGGIGCGEAWIAIPTLILVGLAFIGLGSYWLTEILRLPLPGFVAWALPVTVVVLAASLRVVVESVRLLGGPRLFFCGGAEVVRHLLGLAPAETPKRLVTWGPYSAARHPTYSATLSAYTAASLVFPKILPGLALVALWIYVAARLEERVLAGIPEYKAYAARVPGIAPVRVTLWALGLRRYGPRAG